MSDAPKKPSKKQSASEVERQERQAEALRANLRRRKEQARSRDGEVVPGGSRSGNADD